MRVVLFVRARRVHVLRLLVLSHARRGCAGAVVLRRHPLRAIAQQHLAEFGAMSEISAEERHALFERVPKISISLDLDLDRNCGTSTGFPF